MKIHFSFPIASDITLCGELAENEPVVRGIKEATCGRCQELIKEISRQAVFEAGLRASELIAKS